METTGAFYILFVFVLFESVFSDDSITVSGKLPEINSNQGYDKTAEYYAENYLYEKNLAFYAGKKMLLMNHRLTRIHVSKLRREKIIYLCETILKNNLFGLKLDEKERDKYKKTCNVQLFYYKIDEYNAKNAFQHQIVPMCECPLTTTNEQFYLSSTGSLLKDAVLVYRRNGSLSSSPVHPEAYAEGIKKQLEDGKEEIQALANKNSKISSLINWHKKGSQKSFSKKSHDGSKKETKQESKEKSKEKSKKNTIIFSQKSFDGSQESSGGQQEAQAEGSEQSVSEDGTQNYSQNWVEESEDEGD